MWVPKAIWSMSLHWLLLLHSHQMPILENNPLSGVATSGAMIVSLFGSSVSSLAWCCVTGLHLTIGNLSMVLIPMPWNLRVFTSSNSSCGCGPSQWSLLMEWAVMVSAKALVLVAVSKQFFRDEVKLEESERHCSVLLIYAILIVVCCSLLWQTVLYHACSSNCFCVMGHQSSLMVILPVCPFLGISGVVLSSCPSSP